MKVLRVELSLHELSLHGTFAPENFRSLVLLLFISLYKSMLRPHPEYANSAWNPFKRGDIEDIENILNGYQLVISLKHLPYIERLR